MDTLRWEALKKENQNLPKEKTIYENNGYINRKDYLENLASNMGIDPYVVFSLADVLGSIEDFDGLVSSLEDYSQGY